MTDAAAASELLASMVLHPRTAPLIALLVLAAWLDWRTLRIPNWLTLGGTVYALFYSVAVARIAEPGFGMALAGLAIGLLALLPVYAMGVLGAGDVKLMAMAGAFLGAGGILPALLWTFVAGGLSALAFAASRRATRRMAAHLHDAARDMAIAILAGRRSTDAAPAPSIGRLPYGVCIAAGTIAWLCAHQLGVA